MNKLSLAEVADELCSPKSTLILCHKNPDPDTLGSAFALKRILEAVGSQAIVKCCDEASKKFKFITDASPIKSTSIIDGYERIIAVDVGSASQLGDLSVCADRVDLTIDHHAMSSRFSDYYEDFVPACAMIIYALAKEMKLLDKLPLRFFECVYAGLSGDTGCFKYSNTTPDALNVASELISTGIDFAEINRLIFDCKSLGEISAQKMAYDNLELLMDGKLAIIMITNEMKEKYGVCEDDIADTVNTLRQIQGVLVAVCIKQNSANKDKFSISSRANAEIDVSKICAALGGGGHTRAAGATVDNTSANKISELVIKLFSEGVSAYGK